jgi:uncharacterized membrane protein
MTTFQIILFLHVAAVVGLFVALAIEGLYVAAIGRASSYEQARGAVALERLLLPIGMPSVLVALATGIYLATTMSFWSLGWVKLAVPALVVVAIAGALVGPPRIRIRAAVAKGAGALPDEVKAAFGSRGLVASLRFRSVVLTALLFEMTTKLAGPFDVVALLASVVAGLMWAASFRPRESR